jgi:excisionase family DNA binding protein
MPYTVAEAARAAGKSKSTLLRAIQSGKLSAARDPVTDGWLIEPAELHRVFPAVSPALSPAASRDTPGDSRDTAGTQRKQPTLRRARASCASCAPG